MICSSLYLVRFIVRPFVGSDCNSKSRKNPVAGLAQQESRQAQHSSHNVTVIMEDIVLQFHEQHIADPTGASH